MKKFLICFFILIFFIFWLAGVFPHCIYWESKKGDKIVVSSELRALSLNNINILFVFEYSI